MRMPALPSRLPRRIFSRALVRSLLLAPRPPLRARIAALRRAMNRVADLALDVIADPAPQLAPQVLQARAPLLASPSPWLARGAVTALTSITRCRRRRRAISREQRSDARRSRIGVRLQHSHQRVAKRLVPAPRERCVDVDGEPAVRQLLRLFSRQQRERRRADRI